MKIEDSPFMSFSAWIGLFSFITVQNILLFLAMRSIPYTQGGYWILTIFTAFFGFIFGWAFDMKNFISNMKDAFVSFRDAIDLTPKFVALIRSISKYKIVSIPLFIFLLLAGIFGLFVPIIQGWFVIVLSFSALGITVLGEFVEQYYDQINTVTTILFFVAIGGLIFSWGLYSAGVSDYSPIDNVIDFVQLGQDDLKGFSNETFSVISGGALEYEKIQGTLSVIGSGGE
jgi:hypothetical protein